MGCTICGCRARVGGTSGLEDKEAEDTDSVLDGGEVLKDTRKAGREEGGCSDYDEVAFRDNVEGDGCSDGDYR